MAPIAFSLKFNATLSKLQLPTSAKWGVFTGELALKGRGGSPKRVLGGICA